MYVCETCGMVIDRDFNAAINLEKVGRAHPEPKDACGHDGSVSEPRVTEATGMGETGSQRGAMTLYLLHTLSRAGIIWNLKLSQ